MEYKNPTKETEDQGKREKSWVEEEHVLFNGSVVVFTTKSSKKPWYQVRISLPGVNGYQTRKSLKTTDRNEAIHLATELYLDIRARHSQGLTLQTYDWGMLITEFLKSRNGENFKSQFAYKNKRYWVHFFGTLENIESIDEEMVKEYWKFRIDYWKNHPKAYFRGKDKGRATNVAKEPSYATIAKERSHLRSLFRYGFERRLMPTLVNIEHPYRGDKSRDQQHMLGKKKRASFDKDSYNQLITKMNGLCRRKSWYKISQKRNWEAMKLAILLTRESLIRPQELRALRFEQITTRSDGENIYTVIDIPASQAKTKRPRLIVCENGDAVYKYVQNFRKWAIHKEDHDLIFATDKRADQAKTFDYTWRVLLDKWGLRTDVEGRRRTLYSIRHFAIEQMLLRDVPPLVIAKMAGTSLEMINNFYDETETWLYRRYLDKGRKLFPIEDRSGVSNNEAEENEKKSHLKLV